MTDRIQGLDAGADDYLVKPFSLSELLARIRAVTRRSQGRVVPVMSFGDLSVDPGKRSVKKGGMKISLTAHECKLLLSLMERSGQTVSRSSLSNAVYGSDEPEESNTIWSQALVLGGQ